MEGDEIQGILEKGFGGNQKLGKFKSISWGL